MDEPSFAFSDGIVHDIKLTKVNIQTPPLISHNLIVLSRDAVAKNGPGLALFLPPCKTAEDDS